MSRTWTIREVLKWTAEYFKEKGVSSHRLDAEVLLAHILGTERIQLYLDPDRPLSTDERALYRNLVKKRGNRAPVAYLTGYKEFWSLRFAVTADVLIPRPETELLVETAKTRLKTINTPCIMDLGTGSGCIAIAVADSIESSRILAMDINPNALSVAGKNAVQHGTDKQITFLEIDCFDSTQEGVNRFVAAADSSGFPSETLDAMISNPPYIPSELIPGLQPEISQFEPRYALDGGKDGLMPYLPIASRASIMLKPGGFVLVECGDTQSESVKNILTNTGFMSISVLKDAADRPRCVLGLKG